jgi:hypothetical protein
MGSAKKKLGYSTKVLDASQNVMGCFKKILDKNAVVLGCSKTFLEPSKKKLGPSMSLTCSSNAWKGRYFYSYVKERTPNVEGLCVRATGVMQAGAFLVLNGK